MSGRQALLDAYASAPTVLPSLLMCDFGHLADEIARLEAAGVRALHLDVMDGHFVPNLSYGLPMVETVRRLSKLPIETHLMISNPDAYVESYIDAGADVVTIHAEAAADPRPLLARIRKRGGRAGLAVNPPTPLGAIESALADCDLVLVMSVMPGFGGQKFDAVALEKLETLRSRVPRGVLLEVDGGVNEGTIGRCALAGAQLFVVGSAIFRSQDYTATVAKLTELAHGSSGVRT
jgi:ribulose-phosphate 3-epimerase